MNRRRFLRMMSAAPAAAVAPAAIEAIRPAPYHVGRFAAVRKSPNLFYGAPGVDLKTSVERHPPKELRSAT